MKTLLIRDDDVNHFSTPATLESVYGFLFERDVPVNFSIIPRINTAAKTSSQHFGAGTPEPFLPEEAWKSPRECPIAENTGVIRLLASIRCDKLLHGYRHGSDDGRPEFSIEDKATIDRWLDSAQEHFHAAFGQNAVTFVAPQDKYSAPALAAISERFKVFSTGWIDKTRLSWGQRVTYYGMKLRRSNRMEIGGCLVVEHPGCLFSRFKPVERTLGVLDQHVTARDLTVVVTHHWEFFEPGGDLNQTLHGAFRTSMLKLIADPDVRFTTFSELPSMLRDPHTTRST